MERCKATGKKIHKSKVYALAAQRVLKAWHMNVYHCNTCGGWHLGISRDPYRQQKRIDELLKTRKDIK